MSEASDIQTYRNVRRPPGHHAQDALCGGYCFFNNAAIAAKYLLEDRGSGALAILDVDYHHGNGSRWQMFGLGVSLIAEDSLQPNRSSMKTRECCMSRSMQTATTRVTISVASMLDLEVRALTQPRFHRFCRRAWCRCGTRIQSQLPYPTTGAGLHR